MLFTFYIYTCSSHFLRGGLDLSYLPSVVVTKRSGVSRWVEMIPFLPFASLAIMLIALAAAPAWRHLISADHTQKKMATLNGRGRRRTTAVVMPAACCAAHA